MTKPLLRIFVNGVNTVPGCTKNWNVRAATWCMCYRRLYATYLEYLALPTISRWLFQGVRADIFRYRVQEFLDSGWGVIPIGHSNGNDVILDAFRDGGFQRLEEIHMISPACEADFDKNGLNFALKNNRLGHVFIYIAEKDFWCWAAGTLFGRWLGRYGKQILGHVGPQNIDKSIPSWEKRVTVVRRKKHKHSSWFDQLNGNFNELMSLVLREHPETKYANNTEG